MRSYGLLLLTCICLLCACFPVHAAKPGFMKSASADLDGDGKKETISLVNDGKESNGHFTLKINALSVRGEYGMEAPEGFQLVKIDGSDKYTEVVVSLPGGSDWFQTQIYWYDGHAIHEMNGDDQLALFGIPSFPGNGCIYGNRWMGFWKSTDKYVLDKKTRTVKQVPQQFYYVSGLDEKPVVGKVLHTIPIYETREKKAVIANLRVGSKVLFLLCDNSVSDNNNWYLVKSESGLVGWIQEKAIQPNFEGLMWAG